MSLVITRYSSLEDLAPQAWQRLLKGDPEATVFQSLWWLKAWWHSFGVGTPWLITVHDETQPTVLVAAVALYLDSQKVLRFIGDEHADYGHMPHCPKRADALAAIMHFILKHKGEWASLNLAAVLNESSVDAALRVVCAWKTATIASPRVLFSLRNAADLLSKQSLRRHTARLDRAGVVEVLHLSTPSDIAPYLENFFCQHRKRWAKTAYPSLFVKENNRLFYRALAQSADDSLLFTVVKLDGIPVAMHFGLLSQRTLIWYKPSFDYEYSRYSPGEVLLAQLVRKADEMKLEGIDFTRGNEAFKARFASEVRRVSTWRRDAHVGLNLIARIAHLFRTQARRLWHAIKSS